MRKSSEGEEEGCGNKMHSLLMHFYGGVTESRDRSWEETRSHRLAGHVVNLIWFIFICCAHFFSFSALFFPLSLSLLCWPLSIGSGSGSGSCCKFQVEVTFALPMRPLGQVYCDGSHKFHFYLRQLTTLTPATSSSSPLWRNNLSLYCCNCNY